MKKLMLFFAVATAVSFASCGSKQAAEEVAEEAAVVADSIEAVVDSAAVVADSTVEAVIDSAAAVVAE
ncbi:MAG: hypothetical protein PUG15_08055 [Bacteroidales bacterium]|nr:hypothetical protein [Bacteroidales bacterium]